MAQKIEDLEVTKVDLVDNGANPDAYVMMYKRNREAQTKTDPTTSHARENPLMKFFSTIGKAIGATDREIMEVAELAKSQDPAISESELNTEATEVAKGVIQDEIFDICYAMKTSMASALETGDEEKIRKTLQKNLKQFNEAVIECIPAWSEGNAAMVVKKARTSEINAGAVEKDIARLSGMKTSNANSGAEQAAVVEKKEPKGEENMINKSLMTPAERAFYEDLEKRYSVDGTTNSSDATSTAKSASKKEDEEEVTEKCGDTKKSAPIESTVTETTPAKKSTDPYANLHPAVAAEIQALKKRAEEADERELYEVAKKYEIIGKKPEELVPVLKSLKAAGGTNYADMISVLDASVEAVNKSYMFTEVGKSGSYGGAMSGGNGAWSAIEKKADEIQAVNPEINRYQAIDLACQQNPTLVHEYEDKM